MSNVVFLFSTDFHGSEAVWRKFLNAPKHLPGKIDAIIMGGDMTGKMIIPITETKDGKGWEGFLSGNDYILKTEKELEKFQKDVRFSGYYPYVTTKEEVMELERDKTKYKKLFDTLMAEGLDCWCDLIEERIPEDTKVIICPGNDDTLAIDEVLKQREEVIYGENTLLYIDDQEKYEMISYGWSNPTPWNSPRECGEEELRKKIDELAQQIENMEWALFNLHTPPHGTQIDEAPLLDKDFRVVHMHGHPKMVPVGSTAVREAILEYQPLMGLHGHIHESYGFAKLGRTVCLNPGSEYSEGILRAFLIEIDDGIIRRQQRLEA